MRRTIESQKRDLLDRMEKVKLGKLDPNVILSEMGTITGNDTINISQLSATLKAHAESANNATIPVRMS